MKEESKDIFFKLESGLTCISSPGDEFYNVLIKLKEQGKPLIISDEEFFKGIHFKTKPGWSQAIAISNITLKMGMLSLPERPKSFGKEYQFPDSTENLPSQELGNWMMRLSGWKSYALRLLAKVDMERIILDESFDVSISKKYAELTKGKEKVTKDIVIGTLITENDAFRDLKIKLIEKKAEVETLKKVIDIYSTQFDSISREISRRNSENQTIGKTL